MVEREVNPKVEARIDLGRKRLASVLTRHGVAHIRTLEQKIADAGPTNQRIEPVLLGEALSRMRKAGEVISLNDSASGTKWHRMAAMPSDYVAERLAAQRPIYQQVHSPDFVKRVGDALEVAVFRALLEAGAHHWGGFVSIDGPDDVRYKKIEPPTTYKLRTSASPVDFLALVSNEMLAIEVKNTREWVHPDSDEIRKLLRKATDLDMVPVLIARRIPYVTMATLEACGVLAHQTYNQRYPGSDSGLASQAAHKDLLGYHDVRLGNEPDARMRRFFTELLPQLAPRARTKFDAMKDLLAAFANQQMTYKEFYTELQIRLGNWSRWPEEQYP